MSLVVHRVRTVSSTQDEARRLVAAGEAGPGHAVVADVQTAGRGRFGRTWISPAGGLYVTFVVPRHPRIALVAGVAVVRALERCGVTAGLAWPNDVAVERKKLAGTLIEAVGDVALVGIGVNLLEAPMENATSIRALGGLVRRGELVTALGEELQSSSGDDVVAAYRERLTTLGRTVRITLEGGDALVGTAVDVDPDGRLLVDTAGGLHAVASGECIHLDDRSA